MSATPYRPSNPIHVQSGHPDESPKTLQRGDGFSDAHLPLQREGCEKTLQSIIRTKTPYEEESAQDVVYVHPLKIVKKCLARRSSEVNYGLMSLARGLKFNANLPALEETEVWFWKWIELSAQRCWVDFEPEALWKKFVGLWDLARWPLDTDLALLAFDRSFDAQEPDCSVYYEKKPKMHRLVCMLAELQRMTAPQPFSISARQLEDIFGVHYTNTNQWMHKLEREGVVTCTLRGKQGPPGSPASKYQFNWNQKPCLKTSGKRRGKGGVSPMRMSGSLPTTARRMLG